MKKFTSKWLIEEINHLIDRSFSKPNDEDVVSKKNIANFIYHTASEYAIDLVLRGENTSLENWKKLSKLNKIEL